MTAPKRRCVVCCCSIEHRRAHATICENAGCRDTRDVAARNNVKPSQRITRAKAILLAAKAKRHGWTVCVEHHPLHGWHAVCDIAGAKLRLTDDEDLEWLLADIGRAAA